MAYAVTFLHTPHGYSPATLEAMLGVPVSIQPRLSPFTRKKAHRQVWN